MRGSDVVPVTIREVARRAKVSPATVSRALAASHLVRPATRERVLVAAKELGYQPKPAALGHRRCAYLGGPQASWANRERRRVIRTTEGALDLTVVEFGPLAPNFGGGVQGADLAVAADVTAIVAYNDLMALGVLSRLADRGIRVPDSVSVVGFDNLLYATVCTPSLTTVAQPMEASGRATVDLLLRTIGATPSQDGGPYRELPTHLVVRATTGTPPDRTPHPDSGAPFAVARPRRGREPDA